MTTTIHLYIVLYLTIMPLALTTMQAQIKYLYQYRELL